MSTSLTELLRIAVERKIIDAPQADAMRELADTLAVDDARALAREPGAAATIPREEPRPTEAKRGFNGVMVAYYLGALLVIFAFGWFLVDRWESLGAGGVLAVSLVYAALFAFTGVYLRRQGFIVAGGLALTLAVAMTPTTVWALQSLFGLWPDASSGSPLLRYGPWMSTRWIIVELATIGVALAVVRVVPFSGLAVPIALAFLFLEIHFGQAVGDEELAIHLAGWYWLLAGTVLLAIAYTVDRRTSDGEDYAQWFYVLGLVACAVALIQLWRQLGAGRHILPFASLLVIAASLHLRRRVMLAFGVGGVFVYLGYLAFEVFEDVLNFPIVLATLGLLLILSTVWLQRRFPRLVARLGGGSDDRPSLPGNYLPIVGAVAIAGALLLAAVPDARERAEQRQFRERLARMTRRGSPARPAPMRAPARAATPTPDRPR